MFHAHGYDKGSRITRYETWRRIKEKTGKSGDWFDNQPEIPGGCAYLWAMYVEIKNGCEALGITEIDAYCRVYGVTLSPWEASTLIELELTRRKNGN